MKAKTKHLHRRFNVFMLSVQAGLLTYLRHLKAEHHLRNIERIELCSVQQVVFEEAVQELQ